MLGGAINMYNNGMNGLNNNNNNMNQGNVPHRF